MAGLDLSGAVERLRRLEEEFDALVGFAEEVRRRLVERAESECSRIGDEVLRMVREEVEGRLEAVRKEADEEAERLLEEARRRAEEMRERMNARRDEAVELIMGILLGRR